MSKSWLVEEQDPSENNGERAYWEVKKPNAPFPLFFIVLDVGDHTDGEHLASLLNERERLINASFTVRKLIEAKPQKPVRYPKEWVCEYDAEGQCWRIYNRYVQIPPLFKLINFGDQTDGEHLCDLLNERSEMQRIINEYGNLFDRIFKELSDANE